ncbi:hypothetical protein ACWGST_11150 [Agromyces sp. NPDC055520]
MSRFDLDRELARLGHVARVATLRNRGLTKTTLVSALAAGSVVQPRNGWVATVSADDDQLRAIAVGGRVGCLSALRRFGVWAGTDERLHLHVPRTASRLAPMTTVIETSNDGVWHPTVPERRRRGTVRLASGSAPRVHWAREFAPARALDWIVSPQTALASAVRCMSAEHASAAIDSAIHERVLTRPEVDGVLASLPASCASLVDDVTGQPESGVESIFIRRLVREGFSVEPQFDLAGLGRYDGLIDECVRFEIDGRGFHSGSREFFADRDRTLVAQAFGMPLVRPSALHVLEDWPMVLAAVSRTVADARLVRGHRGLPPGGGNRKN